MTSPFRFSLMLGIAASISMSFGQGTPQLRQPFKPGPKLPPIPIMGPAQKLQLAQRFVKSATGVEDFLALSVQAPNVNDKGHLHLRLLEDLEGANNSATMSDRSVGFIHFNVGQVGKPHLVTFYLFSSRTGTYHISASDNATSKVYLVDQQQISTTGPATLSVVFTPTDAGEAIVHFKCDPGAAFSFRRVEIMVIK